MTVIYRKERDPMPYKRIIGLILVLLALSGCGHQPPEPTSPETTTPTAEPTASVEPVDFEYAGLVLTLDSRFRQGERDQLERMHYESDTMSVTASHCLQDPMDSETRAQHLRNDLEGQWEELEIKTTEDGFSYLICRSSNGTAYVGGQHNFENLGWLVEITGTADVDAMVKLLTGCHPASGSLRISQAQTVTLGALQLTLDGSFRQVAVQDNFSCWLGAPYLLTAERWQEEDPSRTPEALAQEASEQQAYDREAMGIYDWGDVHCMSALGGEEPNIAVAYYIVDGYCYEVTLTGFPENEVEAAVDLVGSGSMQSTQQTGTEVHTLAVEAYGFQDLCSDIEDFGLADKWESYRIHITGLCTDVVLQMNYLDVTTAEVYGKTLEVNIVADEGLMDVAVNQYEDLILLTSSYTSWIIGPDWEYTFPTDDGVCTYVYADEAGQLAYKRRGTYSYFSELSPTCLLDSVSDRGALYQEEGTVTIKDQTPFLEATQRQTVSDVCDLDALFAAAKALGWADYEQYDSADDVLAANKERGIEYPSYPVEPRSIAQTENYQGLTLELPTGFEVDTEAQNALVLNSDSASIQVLTGSIADHFPEMAESITPERLVEYELQHFPEATMGSYKGMPCMISPGLVSTYYISGDQWWLVEATGSFEDELVTLACCGSIQ